MDPHLAVGNRFPDLELPDHRGELVRLSKLTGEFPLILSFNRGYWCPKCGCQLRHLTELQD